MKVETVVGSITVALVLCSSALAATNPNQQGLSQAQIDHGCTMKGRFVSCPSQMQRVEAAPMKRVEAAPIQRVDTSPIRRVEAAPIQRVEAAPIRRVEAGGIQRSALVGKWSGTYICGQGETNVDIDVDENLNGTIRCFASNSRLGPFDGYFKGRFSINGSSVTFRPTNRNVDGWRIPPSDGGRGWSTYGFNANLDTAGKTLDGNILLQGCSTISLVHSASGVPHAMDVNQNISAGNGAHQATNSNQKGLSKPYRDAGCVIAGEYIECPGQRPRYRHTFETPQFGREWQVYVPGTAYTTENRVAGTRTLHTSVGANLPDNTLNIAANGTYWWKADGKLIQGRWVQADEGTLVLQQAYKGVDWKATTEKLGADENGKLVLWQGNEQLKGR